MDNGIDFNFCLSMQSAANAYCQGNYFAGTWTKSETGAVSCVEPLSGPTKVPENSIQVTAIQDRDLNAIGLTLTYDGSESGDYLMINVYCDRSTTLLWDKTYMEHRDTKGRSYSQLTINSKYGCAKIET